MTAPDDSGTSHRERPAIMVDEPQPGPAPVTTPPRPRAARRPDPATFAALLGAIVVALVGIGPPLLGIGVFAGTDALTWHSPYLDAGGAGTVVQNKYMPDIYNSMLPAQDLYAQTVAEGDPAHWNPYITAGTPLGATPNYALLSPITLPYYLLPSWLAPAYVKLVEIVVAVLGCALFLRRVGLRWASGLVGGIIFATSAFMVMWTNWPQTRVAAMIPWVFWAVERIIQRRRPADAVLLAAAVGAMLVGGFPAVTAFTLLTAGAYVVVRILVTSAQWRARLRLLAGVGAAVLGGLALAAVQVLPFARLYPSWHVAERAQTAADHLTPTYLVTTFAPWFFGGAGTDTQPSWYLEVDNLVEASSYLGAAALVLVVAAIALARPARTLLPRGVMTFFIAAAGAWAIAIYTSGPLRVLVELPVFSSNFVGRARSVLGFLLAVLAAVGLEVLLRRREAVARAGPGRPWARAWPAAVLIVAGATLTGVVLKARSVAAAHDGTSPDATNALANADRQLWIGLALLAVATLAALAAHRAGGRPARVGRAALGVGAVVVLVAVTVGQALSYVVPYWPRSDRATYYPTTDTHQFLADNLGDDRYVGTADAMPQGTNSSYRLRALGGHTFINAELAALLAAVPSNAVKAPTQVFVSATAADARSPVLDRLAGRYFVTSPRDPVLGRTQSALTDFTATSLRPGEALDVPVPVAGPLRAVGVTPVGAVPPPGTDTWVSVAVRDADGRTVAEGRRLTVGMVPGEPFLIPVPEGQVPPGTALTASLTLHAPTSVPVAALAATAAITAVAAEDDGLRLVHAGSSVIYERLTTLPRVRWASSTLVEPDRQRRVDLIASGALPADQVVLNQPGPAATGQAATVSVDTDDPDAITVTVAADGDGYLVVADAIAAGWTATVDGHPTELRAADQAVVAVAVPAGTHTVVLRYTEPYGGAGTWITLAALGTGAVIILLDRLAATRRRSPRRDNPPRTEAQP